MSIQRLDLQLSAARSDFAVNLGAAAWIRFFQVDASVDVKVDSQASFAFPIAAPCTINACNRPFTQLYLTHAAASGVFTIVWSSDGEENVDDFLAGNSLATSQAFLLTQSVLSQGVWNPNIAVPQEIMGTPGTALTPTASAGGTAGQNFSTTLPYYGGITASVLASAVALNGGSFVWSSRPLNMTAILNALQTTALTFTRSAIALSQVGYWFIKSDWLLETPTIGLPALHMVAALGLGFEPATTATTGLGGCRGCAIIWSNDRGNNNFWLVACDGTNVVQALDLGVSALGHHMVEYRFGVLGGVPQIEAVIDGVSRGTLSSLGMSMAVISAMAASVWLPRIAAYKIQAAQNGNNVSLRHGGYADYVVGRYA